MSDLRRRAAGGIRWSAVSMAGTTVLQFVRFLILARLLPPEAFGIMAMVMVVIVFAQIMGEMGLSEAIIQRQQATHLELSSLYWLNIAFGVSVFLMLWLLTPFVARFFATSHLTSLLPVTAASFLILPWGTQYQALLQKRLRFKTLAAVEICSAFVNTIVAIVTVCLGQGVWSLVWGHLAGALARTVILLFTGSSLGYRPSLYFSLHEVKGYLTFGLHRVGAMALNFFNTRVDQLLIGKLLGAEALGYYSLAFTLVLQPILRLNPILNRVAFPIFSLVQKDIVRLRHGFFQMINILLTVDAPILIGMSVVSKTAIPLFLGSKWLPSVPLLQILPFYALLRSLTNAGGSLILARGKVQLTFYWSVVLFFIVPVVIYLVGRSGNLIYIAWALLGLQFVLTLAHYQFLIRAAAGPCFRPYLKAFGTPALYALVMGLVVWAAVPIMAPIGLIGQLSVQIALGTIVYLGILWITRGKQLKELVTLLIDRE